jgi:hypothetical protein
MKRILLIILVPLLGFSFQSWAQGDLLITQKRVVFEGAKQIEELDMVNIGKDTAIYSISFVHFNMKEDGSYVTIDKPDSGQMFADPYLRIFPRQVTLAPGEPQIIMLQCRRNSDMTPGEYRSHLYFRSEKNYKPLGTKNNDTTKLAVQLIPVYGISIPILIRSGQGNASVTLSDLKPEIHHDTLSCLRLTINRIGNISVYGDLLVEYIDVKGSPHEIGKIMNLGVLSNTNKRNVVVKLDRVQETDFKNGKLRVSYTNNDIPKKPVMYVTGELDL